MEQERFDAALRALQAGTTRRAGLAGMLGVLLGGVGAEMAAARGRGSEGSKSSKVGNGGSGGSDEALGRRKPSGEGPCGDGSRQANRCSRDGQCCTKYCAGRVCRCKPNWMACGKSDQCCSGRCVGGKCDGGANPAGSACVENFNCKDGLACVGGKCTPSNRAKCGAGNCPGCCQGTVCRVGGAAQACGAGGGACSRCPAGVACANGSCGQCGPASCPAGCCDNGTCVTATSGAACGAGGAACVMCVGSVAPVCAAGTCGAGTWSYSAKFGTQGVGDDNFSAPKGIYVSPDMLTAWVAEYNNHRVAIWTRPDAASTSWSYSTKFGTQGVGDGNLNNPISVFVSADTLTAWVAEANNSRISVWTRPDAASKTWAFNAKFGSTGSGNNNFFNPMSVVVSADTLTAWVADMNNSRIAIWTRPDAASQTWSYSAQFGTNGSGDDNFATPFGVAVSADTLTAWVADSTNSRISIWTRPDASSKIWSFSARFGSPGQNPDNLTSPVGVFVSKDALTVWVVNQTTSRISIWTRPDAASKTWSYNGDFGSYGSGDNNFNWPNNLYVSADSLNAWIADSNNGRIAIWKRG